MTRSRGAARGWLGGFFSALGFLTVLPIPETVAARARGSTTVFFPWVGLLLGLSAAAVVRLPWDMHLGAVLSVAFLFAVTGGLHWDGWADALDAAVPPGLARDKRIAILGDPRVGAHAVVGVGLLLMLAVWGLARAPLWGVVLGSALGRWVMVATLRWAPPLRSHGAGARMRGEARPLLAAIGVLAPAATGVVLGGVGAGMVLAMVCGLGMAALSATALVHRLGGLNGDGHGAVGLLTEVTIWAASAELAGAAW